VTSPLIVLSQGSRYIIHRKTQEWNMDTHKNGYIEKYKINQLIQVSSALPGKYLLRKGWVHFKQGQIHHKAFWKKARLEFKLRLFRDTISPQLFFSVSENSLEK